ncbi:GNAT family N-acetyltransferase [Acuticoccus sp. MNP-M23]|uniref:GNAT family N-acetyltransferase n=1 Tax=Acuticoccus sp. MNP-M23 TaxID=3072793 RepID=UPI0028156E45|nr:GNAT family N-acetyltransferase [Acuticoccus sp. MNP-M23]WMS44134.1 GNAT family N-acetyltransferase [Acuticoccus sp. MNP-M23]
MAVIDRPLSLGPFDAGRALPLSNEAGWNQLEADWLMMLRLGLGFGFEADGRLVASAVALPYGPVGWISMVLVTAAARRQGLATRLVETAAAALERAGARPALDATPAGEAVYRTMGFQPLRQLTRWQGTGWHAGDAAASVRPARPDDLHWICAMDRSSFGLDRRGVLADLLARPGAPAFAREAKDGFLLARAGRNATHLGPLTAASPAAANALLHTALAQIEGPVIVDAFDDQPALGATLRAAGFTPQRPFARMARGADPLPGNHSLTHAAAGPELG